MADHFNDPCHIVCVQEGSGFVTDNKMQVNFYVVTQHPCAVLLNKDTFVYDISCTPFQVPCSLRYSAWAVQGMAATDEFRGAPDQSCSFFTIANILINKKCAKRCSVCIALLLLVQDPCLKLGAFVLTGDLNKVVERETPSGDGERRTSPMEAAFTNLPWPTGGVLPLCGPCCEPNGKKWPDCCGFVVLPESQSQWLLRHGSIDVVPASVGFEVTEYPWHYEQWLHLMFAGRKRRRNTSPADSNSRQKIVLHTKRATSVAARGWYDGFSTHWCFTIEPSGQISAVDF